MRLGGFIECRIVVTRKHGRLRLWQPQQLVQRQHARRSFGRLRAKRFRRVREKKRPLRQALPLLCFACQRTKLLIKLALLFLHRGNSVQPRAPAWQRCIPRPAAAPPLCPATPASASRCRAPSAPATGNGPSCYLLSAPCCIRCIRVAGPHKASRAPAHPVPARLRSCAGPRSTGCPAFATAPMEAFHWRPLPRRRAAFRACPTAQTTGPCRSW